MARALVVHPASITWPDGVVAGRLHLTVVHFGRTQDLVSELQDSCGVHVEVKQLREAIAECATPARLPGCESAVLGCAILGSAGRPVPVVLLDYPAEGVVTRTVMWETFMARLRTWGVRDPQWFASRSSNLRHNLPAVWRPHISVRSGFPQPWSPATATIADAVLLMPGSAGDPLQRGVRPGVVYGRGGEAPA